MRTNAWFCLGVSLLLSTACVRANGVPDFVYYFENTDRPAEAVDARGNMRDLKFTKDSHLSEAEKRFGKGSLLIQPGVRAATAGWYVPLKSIPEFTNGIESLTITLWIRPGKDGAIPLVRRSQFSAQDPGAFGFYVDGAGRLVFSVDKQKVQSNPVELLSGGWTHLAVTLDRNVVKFFVNGELWEAIDEGIQPIQKASESGALSGFLSSHAGLYVDDFGFFGARALNEAEIKKVYADGLESFSKQDR